MSARYRLPRGTKDFLPQEAYAVSLLENNSRKIFRIYGYEEVRLPFIENSEVFIRSLGQTSEIIERQIFKIEAKDNLCLRPEATAQVVRSYIENAFYQHKLSKLFYIGAMFRGERPQKGRLRQFHHIGAEAIGQSSPFLDVEVISLARDLLLELGVDKFELKINSLGCVEDKERLKALLREKLSSKHGRLCEDCQKRFSVNILRVLDCKKPACKELVASLDIGRSYLCKDCSGYFDTILDMLKSLSIDYSHVATLVRGLDYYTRTVFEFTSPLLGAQDAVGAGGRYDNLVQELGGPSRPACGFALGLERILLLRGKEPKPRLRAFVVYAAQDLQKQAFMVLRSLRQAGISSDMSFDFTSLKSQLRLCQKLEADFAVILGPDEMRDKILILRDMKASVQDKIEINDLIKRLKPKEQD
ncbi:MAG: histidine--tRNA ligase [Candidatus Omnitrophica bacterium]|nr:histidine--tRNA ligase [Candidatus Omnitrophota bacterium]